MTTRTIRLDAVSLSHRDVSALSTDELIKHARKVIAAPRRFAWRIDAKPEPVSFDPIAQQRDALQSWGRKSSTSTSTKVDGTFAASADAPLDHIAQQREALAAWGRSPITGR